MKWFLAIFLTFSFVFVAVFGVNCVYGYLFPMKYQKEIAAACEQFDVEQAVVFSLINVESRFEKNAVSSRGAQGLMQIMPSTAESLTNEDFDLFEPADNIKLGTKYFAMLLNRFDNVETALAAYNAGPTTVKNWLEDERYSLDGVTLKKIPYAETRGYIKKFNKNLKYYSRKTKTN